MGNKHDVEHPEPEKAKELAGRYEVNYEECSAKEDKGVVELFNKLALHLANQYGDSPDSADSHALSPKVSIREGRGGCCSKN